MSFDPTGRQIYLRTEAEGRVVTAQIAQVGAALRHLTVDGVDLVPPYPAGITAPAASGTVLVPWPNRVRDGRWIHEGEPQQLAITEPKLNNASHGLLRFTAYDTTEADSSVTLRADVFPQTGYGFHLQTSVTYALVADGIVVTHTIRNVGDRTAPVAIGAHPFITLGDTPPEALTLTSSGANYIEVDERLLPVATVPVTETTDLRNGAILAALHLDTAYTSLTRDPESRAVHTLSDGTRSVSLWQGPGFDYVQFYTARPYPGRDVALAIEPMTAPADAFNSGHGLRWLAPEEAWRVQWGISLDS